VGPTSRPRVHRILLLECVSRAPEILFLFPSSVALIPSPTPSHFLPPFSFSLPLHSTCALLLRDAHVIIVCHLKFMPQHWTKHLSLVKIVFVFTFNSSYCFSPISLSSYNNNNNNSSETSTHNTPISTDSKVPFFFICLPPPQFP